jgi:lipopolysaccharide/colanic/teichoic acid biosynthesis glycosyltransferase
MIRIFNIAFPARVISLVISEIALISGCYVIAAWGDADLGGLDVFFGFDSGFWRISVVVLLVIAGFYFRNMYQTVRIADRVVLLQELCMIFGIALIGQGLVGYLSPDLLLPRRVMLAGSALALPGCFVLRLAFDSAAREVGALERVLVLGMSPTALHMVRLMLVRPELGLLPVAYLDDKALPESPIPQAGRLDDLDRVMEAMSPAAIVIGRRDAIRPEWTNDFLELHFGGVRTEEASALYERALGRICGAEIRPAELIFTSHFEPGGIDANLQMLYSRLLAVFFLVLLSPVLLMVTLAIRLSSGSAIFERRPQAGKHGVFTALRFRADPDSRAGRFLRRTGLVALPLLFNVAAGSMTLVGPRAERPEFADYLEEAIPFYAQRRHAAPGLIGWAQLYRISGSVRDTLEDLEFDLYYIKHLSVSLDFAVLFLWLKRLVLGGGAEHDGSDVRLSESSVVNN